MTNKEAIELLRDNLVDLSPDHVPSSSKEDKLLTDWNIALEMAISALEEQECSRDKCIKCKDATIAAIVLNAFSGLRGFEEA